MSNVIVKTVLKKGRTPEDLTLDTISHLQVEDAEQFQQSDHLLIIQNYGTEDQSVLALDMESLFELLTLIKYVPPIEYLRMCDYEDYLSDFQGESK